MIFCYEENDKVRRLMLDILRNYGFECCVFNNIKVLFDALDGQKPQLVIADAAGAEAAGYTEYLCEVCREKRITILMMILKMNTLNYTSANGKYFLYKPFNESDFIDEVKRALNGHVSVGEELRFGQISVYAKERRVEVDGEEIILTNKEYELLRFLFENPDRVFSREQLFYCIWGSDFMGSSRTVDVHIGTLRNKLKGAGTYIKTVRGKGYLASEIQQ